MVKIFEQKGDATKDKSDSVIMVTRKTNMLMRSSVAWDKLLTVTVFSALLPSFLIEVSEGSISHFWLWTAKPSKRKTDRAYKSKCLEPK